MCERVRSSAPERVLIGRDAPDHTPLTLLAPTRPLFRAVPVLTAQVNTSILQILRES